MISIQGLPKEKVLAALYNNAKPLGRGFLHYTPGPLSDEEVREQMEDGRLYFDYVKGRVMKVDLSGDTLDPYFYDRDNGRGAAELALLDAGLVG